MNTRARSDIAHTLAKLFILLCNVLASSALLITNKFVLQSFKLPGRAAGLTLLHYLCALCFVRLIGYDTKRAAHIPWTWLLCIATIGSLSVWASNIILQLSSITFHQLAKLSSLPVGALVDYAIRQKSLSWVEIAGMCTISYGVLIASAGEVVLYAGATVAAFIWVSCYVSAAALLRYVCEQYDTSASEFLYFSTPWSLLSCLLWCFGDALMYDKWVWTKPHLSNILAWDKSTALLIMNLTLAVLVQWLSTWTARNCSTTIYAVLGQAKTAATITLSVPALGESLSACTTSGLAMCLSAASALAFYEHSAPNYMRLQVFHSQYIKAMTVILLLVLIVVTLHYTWQCATL